MANLAIIHCKKLKDYYCVACTTCFECLAARCGDFADYDDVHLVAMTDCGDCPGLIVPRVRLLVEDGRRHGRTLDVVHLGACVKAAQKVVNCPVDLEATRRELQETLGVRTVIGEHWS